MNLKVDQQAIYNEQLSNNKNDLSLLTNLCNPFTISMVIIDAKPHIKIVIAILKNIGFTQLRIDEMKPKLLEIGTNVQETKQLIDLHENLCTRLVEKQSQVDDLLIRANKLANEQTEKNNILVYSAMAESLSSVWKELNQKLDLRGYILRDTLYFYITAQNQKELFEKTNLLQINDENKIEEIQQIFNELIQLTSEAVDDGSNIIGQIRVLGLLADSLERPQEIVDACLLIEHVMLCVVQRWEAINSIWNENFKIQKAQLLVNKDGEQIIELLNLSETWINTAYQTYNTSLETMKNGTNDVYTVCQTIEVLITELQTHKNALEKINFNEIQLPDLQKRFNQLCERLEELKKILESKLQFINRIKEFYKNSDSVFDQLSKMANELINANASMASELGPLAQQKTDDIIEKGNKILCVDDFSRTNKDDYEKVNAKLEQLKKQFNIVEKMVQDRIESAKLQNAKLQKQLQLINMWLQNGPEAFLAANINLGTDYTTCIEFITQHKKVEADINAHEPELYAVLSYAPKMISSDRKKVADLQLRFNSIFQILESRLSLGQNFEKVQKFAREIEVSIDLLSTLLDSSINANNIDNTVKNVPQQICDVFQTIKETMQREKHHGDKFICNAKAISKSDTHLQVNEAINVIQSLIFKHEKLFFELKNKLEIWHSTQTISCRISKIFEEVKSWQTQQENLICVIENNFIHDTTQQNSLNNHTPLLRNLIEALEQIPYIKQKISTIDEIKEMPSNLIIIHKQLNEKQNELDQKLFKLHKKLFEATSKISETQSSLTTTKTSSFENVSIDQKKLRKPKIINELNDVVVEEGERFELSAKVDPGLPEAKCVWKKNDSLILSNLYYRFHLINNCASLVIEEILVEDSALYTLILENENGFASTSARITVKPKLKDALQQQNKDLKEKPQFKRQLENVTATEGSKAVLDCVITGLPEPNVIWFKEEECICESERFKLEFYGDHCSLTIHPVLQNDSGIYKVKAVNEHGENVAFSRLIVTPTTPTRKIPPPTPPKPLTVTPVFDSNLQTEFCIRERPALIDMPLINQSLTEGQCAIFQAHILGSPTLKIIWLFENFEIPTIKNNEFEIENNIPTEGFTRLTIKNVSIKLSGLYTVIVKNSCGESHSSATLSVNKTTNVIQSNYCHEKNKHNSPQFFLQHKTRAFSPSNKDYLINGNLQLSEYQHHQQYRDQNRQKSPVYDKKEYNANILLNEYSSKELSDMGFSSIANAPEVIRPFQSEYTINEGEKIKIDCLMVGNPRPRVNWFFNNRLIKSNFQFAEFLNIGDTYSISFASARLENAGYYRIIAENVRGKTECLTLIHIRPRSMIPQPVGRLTKTQSLEQKRIVEEFGLHGLPHRSSVSPYLSSSTNYINAFLPNKELTDDQMSTSTYVPQKTFSPKHRSCLTKQTLKQFSKEILQRQNYCSSHLEQQQQQTQSFDLTLNNKLFGESKQKETATINNQINNEIDVTDDSPPHFCLTLVSIIANINDLTKFEAIITGIPTPKIEWTKNGEVLNQFNTNAKILNINGHAKLEFSAVSINDSGKYTCIAQNEYGIATSSAQLVVRPKTIAPDFIKRLISKEVAEGERLKWTVKIIGEPAPKITWLRNGQLIPNCDEVRLIQESNDEYSMIIECVEAADGGQFTCLLKNDAGETRSTADLMVRPAESEPGSYFDITKVTEEKQVILLKNEKF